MMSHFFDGFGQVINQIKHVSPKETVELCKKEAVILLKSMDFNNIANMAGGIVELQRDDCPLVINKKERLKGSCMCMLRKPDKK